MKQYLQRLIAGETLSRQDTHNILVSITRQAYPTEQIAALLMAIQARGATVDEMLGFRDGLLETGKHVNLDGFDTLDIVGTGGDGKNTFNPRPQESEARSPPGARLSPGRQRGPRAQPDIRIHWGRVPRCSLPEAAAAEGRRADASRVTPPLPPPHSAFRGSCMAPLSSSFSRAPAAGMVLVR